MNIQRCLSCVLLLFVCFYVLFSPLHTVYAQDDGISVLDDNISTLELSEEDIKSGNVLIKSAIGGFLSDGSSTWIASVSKLSTGANSKYISAIPKKDFSRFFNDVSIEMSDVSIVVEKGKSVNFEITGLVNNAILITNSGGTVEKYKSSINISSFYVYFLSAENSWKGHQVNLSDISLSQDTNGNIRYNLNVTNNYHDAYRVIFRYFYLPYDFYINSYSNFPNIDYTSTEYDFDIEFGFDENSGFNFKVEEESTGLLRTILESLKSIWDGVKNLPSNIANAIKGFFDNVVNAVVNLGNFIIEGIKGLFIPSEEDITKMKDKWDTLLSDRFGALYQVAGLISDYAASFKEQSKNTITFPSVSIPLAGATFEFGGWEVQVVPDGFGIIFDTLKMITSILATFLFINGLKNRFDKIMGGADDI